MSVPVFRYHPDPVSTGSAVETEAACAVCADPRGVRYEGPMFGLRPDPATLCLECISSGRASRELAVGDVQLSFTDEWGAPGAVSPLVIDEITTRTPGFFGWQQTHWMYHCDDGAAFLGRVGYADLAIRPDALDMVLHENNMFGWTEEQSRRYARSLSPDGDATAYLFRCLHCATHLAYTDMS